MSDLVLYIGDKNLSSWSLRPWLAAKVAGIAFSERLIRLDQKNTKKEILEVSPSGRVPCLKDGAVIVWDSLAICEYLAERFPEKRLWPENAAARATARSVSSEMHSGFSDLRGRWPMKFAQQSLRASTEGIEKDIARIIEIWESCRRDYGREGPFLFGRFSIADAMFAPVVSRFVTYGPVALPEASARWSETVWALPAMREWSADAKAEVA